MKRKLLFLCTLLCCCLSSQAEIYQWIDQAGQVHLSNQKPADNSQIKSLKILPAQPEIQTQGVTSPKAKTKADSNSFKPAKLILYTADWCSQCRQARSYLRHKNIPFQDYNVETSHKGAADYKRMGSGKLPIVILNDNTSRGFSIKGFEQQWQLLNKAP